MISRAKDIFDGSLVHTTSLEDTPHVTSVKSVGVRKVVAIATSTRTFIANGYLSHNCQGSAADVLYQSTLELDRQGLSDHIHLWMHDELIVDTSVESDVVAAMQKPPEALMRWARTNKVMLRTDANPMGGYWKAV
jgi:DNA polymerase I-like protein with 3'-5' exonuclease and polymerase domains